MSTQENNNPTAADETTTLIGGAVLLSDEIEKRCQDEPRLIEPFYSDEDHLKPASYHLSVGEQVRIDGVDYSLSIDNPVREIPPHGIAMIRTRERLNLPNDLIARWNIKVKEVYYGLVWVGGPQVDPGYNGPLVCPVFNLSTKPYRLEYCKPLFTIDFVKTTPFISGTSKQLDIGRNSESIGALDKLRTESAIKEQLEKREQEVSKLRTEVRAFQLGTMTAITILFAVLGLLIAFQFTGIIDWASVKINWIHLGLSLAAFVASGVALTLGLFSWFKWR